MRKTKQCVLWLLIFVLLCPAVHSFAAEQNSSNVVLAINESVGYADGKPFERWHKPVKNYLRRKVGRF